LGGLCGEFLSAPCSVGGRIFDVLVVERFGRGRNGKRMMAEGPVFITGTAGFIGFHLARRLLAEGRDVIGLDGMSAYYDVTLKRDRLAILARSGRYTHHEFMLEDADRLMELVAAARPAVVVHLAAQAGVRYSIENPRIYIQSNVVGTFNLLEACREHPPAHLLIASTSSVYGDGDNVPYSEGSESARPLSLYAATKKSTEVMAHAYAHLHRLPTTVFRFFTVYGPWGRPDMALFKFTAAILAGREIEVYGYGEMSRDFTYIDDLVAGIAGLMPAPPGSRPATPADSPAGPYRIVNIGASQPVGLEEFIAAIEKALGRKARRKYLPMQPADVRRTFAETAVLKSLVDMPPATSVETGVKAFTDWYVGRYGIAAEEAAAAPG
jgi:UDP-glucuronate 4-epimerase